MGICYMTQGSQTGALGGKFGREGTRVYLWLILIDLWQKTTRYCKVIILQFKKMKGKKKKESMGRKTARSILPLQSQPCKSCSSSVSTAFCSLSHGLRSEEILQGNGQTAGSWKSRWDQNSDHALGNAICHTWTSFFPLWISDSLPLN